MVMAGNGGYLLALQQQHTNTVMLCPCEMQVLRCFPITVGLLLLMREATVCGRLETKMQMLLFCKYMLGSHRK